jgi:hypothetical protein
VQYIVYTTGTPARLCGPLLQVVASRAACLRYGVYDTSSYMSQYVSADCGSEGRGFESHRSPQNLRARKLTATVLQPG